MSQLKPGEFFDSFWTRFTIFDAETGPNFRRMYGARVWGVSERNDDDGGHDVIGETSGR